jgi:hypothetical protein
VDVVGDTLFRRKLCQGLFNSPRFLEQITVRGSDGEFVCTPCCGGDFKVSVGHQLATDTVLRVRPQAGGLVLETTGKTLTKGQN